MRLIDADELIEWVENELKQNRFNKFEVEKIINFAPTTDAEPVVRCKDCKHNEGGTCGYSEFNIETDDYCSFGERREP